MRPRLRSLDRCSCRAAWLPSCHSCRQLEFVVPAVAPWPRLRVRPSIPCRSTSAWPCFRHPFSAGRAIGGQDTPEAAGACGGSYLDGASEVHPPASTAADACTRRALGRAIPLAGRGEGWSAPQLPPAHLTKSPRSLLVPVGDFISRTRRSSRAQPGHDRNALRRPRRHRRRNYPAAGACESTSAAHAMAGLYPTNSGKGSPSAL